MRTLDQIALDPPAPAALLPAAGASRRMGRPKLLLPWRGSTVVGAVVAALQGGGVGRIVLVARPGDDALAAWAERHGVEVAVNPQPDDGMLASVQVGLRRLLAEGPPPAPLLVCPADLPDLSAATVSALLAAWANGPHELLVPLFDGRRGHPLLVAPCVLAEIFDLAAERGLRGLLDRHPVGALPVEDRGVLRDVDTPEDYARGSVHGGARVDGPGEGG